MIEVIRRLLDNAPEIDNPIVKHLKSLVPENAQRRYLECQVVLKGGYSMAGVLTYAADTAGDTLLLVAVAQTPDKKIMLAEHYFSPADVVTIVVGVPMPETLVRPVRNGGPIILGA